MIHFMNLYCVMKYTGSYCSELEVPNKKKAITNIEYQELLHFIDTLYILREVILVLLTS